MAREKSLDWNKSDSIHLSDLVLRYNNLRNIPSQLFFNSTDVIYLGNHICAITCPLFFKKIKNIPTHVLGEILE